MRATAIIAGTMGSDALLRAVGGRTLIGRCITTCNSSRAIEASFVCSGDAHVAAAAARLGCRVLPPPAPGAGAFNSAMFSSTAGSAMLIHALHRLADQGIKPDAIMLLDPMRPFTRALHLDEAVARFEKTGADVVFSARDNEPPNWPVDEDDWATGAPSVLGSTNNSRSCVETGNFLLVRTARLRLDTPLSFSEFLASFIPAERALAIRSDEDLQQARWASAGLDPKLRRLPSTIDAIVFDFDGVFTENTVYVDQDGRELVRASRGDGLGLELLRKAGIPRIVLSKEQNPVVLRRCEKLKIPCIHGVEDKLPILRQWVAENGYRMENIVYLGNDINDVTCVQAAGCGLAVADAHPQLLAVADFVLDARGGRGAVRELCDLALGDLALATRG